VEDIFKIENIQVEKRDELIVELGLAMLDIVDINKLFCEVGARGGAA